MVVSRWRDQIWNTIFRDLTSHTAQEMRKPEHSGSDFYNYKHYFSVQLMAVCDVKYRFLFIDVGAKGKQADSTIFKQSKFYKKLENGTIQLPESKPLSGQNIPSPYVFVGDEGFGRYPFMLRPYAGSFLPLKKKSFNYRLLRARRVIECAVKKKKTLQSHSKGDYRYLTYASVSLLNY